MSAHRAGKGHPWRLGTDTARLVPDPWSIGADLWRLGPDTWSIGTDLSTYISRTSGANAGTEA